MSGVEKNLVLSFEFPKCYNWEDQIMKKPNPTIFDKHPVLVVKIAFDHNHRLPFHPSFLWNKSLAGTVEAAGIISWSHKAFDSTTFEMTFPLTDCCSYLNWLRVRNLYVGSLIWYRGGGNGAWVALWDELQNCVCCIRVYWNLKESTIIYIIMHPIVSELKVCLLVWCSIVVWIAHPPRKAN